MTELFLSPTPGRHRPKVRDSFLYRFFCLLSCDDSSSLLHESMSPRPPGRVEARMKSRLGFTETFLTLVCLMSEAFVLTQTPLPVD